MSGNLVCRFQYFFQEFHTLYETCEYLFVCLFVFFCFFFLGGGGGHEEFGIVGMQINELFSINFGVCDHVRKLIS